MPKKWKWKFDVLGRHTLSPENCELCFQCLKSRRYWIQSIPFDKALGIVSIFSRSSFLRADCAVCVVHSLVGDNVCKVPIIFQYNQYIISCTDEWQVKCEVEFLNGDDRWCHGRKEKEKESENKETNLVVRTVWHEIDTRYRQSHFKEWISHRQEERWCIQIESSIHVYNLYCETPFHIFGVL